MTLRKERGMMLKKPEKKEEYETCTRCGGLGRTPNHPHIKAHTCPTCCGVGKIIRPDYKQHNLEDVCKEITNADVIEIKESP